MHPALAKPTEDGITNYIFSAKYTRKIPFFLSLLMIIFFILTFTLNFFDSSVPVQASNIPFNPSSDLLINVKTSA